MFRKLFLITVGCCAIMFNTDLSHADFEKFRIGISSWSGYPASVKGFKDSLAEEGLIEGKNTEFMIEDSGADKTRQREIAERFKKEKLNLVYSITTPGTLVMKEVLPPSTPIVFSVVSFPVEVGFIKSYEKSGTNLVGTSNFIEPHHFIKLLTTILPNARTVAIFRRSNEPNSTMQKNMFLSLLAKEGIQFVDLPASTIEELRDKAMQNADKVNVFITTQDTLIQGGGEDAIIKVSLEKKIPILSSNKAGIEKGSAFGPVADFNTLGKMSGKIAVKILKEKAKPADMKSQKQEPPVFLINKKTINALGIQIPEGKLQNVEYVE